MCIQSNDDNTKLPGSRMARSMAEAQRCELQMGKVFDASCIFSKLTLENEMTTLPLVMLEISMPSVRFCRGGSKHAVIGSVCQSCRCPWIDPTDHTFPCISLLQQVVRFASQAPPFVNALHMHLRIVCVMSGLHLHSPPPPSPPMSESDVARLLARQHELVIVKQFAREAEYREDEDARMVPMDGRSRPPKSVRPRPSVTS